MKVNHHPLLHGALYGFATVIPTVLGKVTVPFEPTSAEYAYVYVSMFVLLFVYTFGVLLVFNPVAFFLIDTFGLQATLIFSTCFWAIGFFLVSRVHIDWKAKSLRVAGIIYLVLCVLFTISVLKSPTGFSIGGS